MAMNSFVSFFYKDPKTFKKKSANLTENTMRYELHKRANASLQSELNLKQVVKLPEGEDMNEWIAVHVVDFFNRINVIYGVVCEVCSESSCPVMSGGPKYEYHWMDGSQYKKPTQLPAPQYIALLMDWVEGKINNQNIFPGSVGVPFPKNYISTCKKILTRLFRVFVHVYIHHFDKLVSVGAKQLTERIC